MTSNPEANLPLITVAITCYNYARYVGFAIESALAQDYTNREVVVVNDGSTDDSLEIISRYRTQVRVVDQLNQGWISAYNTAFAASRGDIVIFLDADDLLDIHALGCVARKWSPTCAKVQYDLKIVDASGNDLGGRFCGFTPDYDSDRIRDSFRRTGTYRWPVTTGNAYSRWFLSIFFPLSIEHGPDGTLNTIAPVYGDIRTIPTTLGSYRLHGANGWGNVEADWGRLPERIRHRQQEVALLHEHANRRGVPLPPGNVLDHELTFINYRLMAWKLGLAYPAKSADSPLALLWHAFTTLRFEQYPPLLSLGHYCWFGALFASPYPLSRWLMTIRYNRRALLNRLRRRLRIGRHSRGSGEA
jgi:glycosyltransferase involved in cell wall biosynthesis